MIQLARFVKPFIDSPAPNPDSLNPAELLGLARLAKRFRALGPENMVRKIKMLTMSATDFLGEWFES
ncbi:MAG: amine oxidase, partial [Planctomycetes bacterium]|nr:amine oxidase [Planctomycetota bacterium]